MGVRCVDFTDVKYGSVYHVKLNHKSSTTMSSSAVVAPVDPTSGSSVVSSDILAPKKSVNDSNNVVPGRKTRLEDLRRIIEADDRFEEVTVEQIERVKLMHDRFMEGAVPNFNYNTLLLVAAVIAGLGLVSNSSATIIASMLGKVVLWCAWPLFSCFFC